MGRLRRRGSFAVVALAATALAPTPAGATVIKVDTLAETADFDPPGPVYTSKIVGDNGTKDRCSLREAVAASNLDRAVKGCPAGNGADVIDLMAGVYHVEDNLFIEQRVTIRGPNSGFAGNDPARGPEAVLSFDDNPNYAAQTALLWLDQESATGTPKGAGSVVDGVVLRGGFNPSCVGRISCEIVAIAEPDQGAADAGFTLTDSIVREFSFALYLGGRNDTIKRNRFEDNDRNPAASGSGNDIYSDPTYTAPNPVIDDNVFANPLGTAIILQGDEKRGTIFGAEIARNAILKAPGTPDSAVFVVSTAGVTIKDNLIANPKPGPLATRADTGIRLDRVNDVQVTGNTLTGLGAGIGLGDTGAPSPVGVTDVTVANNRIYDNLYGVRVRPMVFGTDIYVPLALDANDNWWGANGGPGSAGARPGVPNPVNGVQFVTSANAPVAGRPGVATERSLQLACTAPGTVLTKVPAPVTGQVLGMPTVASTPTTAPWFIDHEEPLMAASAPGIGDVFGFDQVPDQGPDDAQLTGALVATDTGTGNVLVDLDSERAACPVTATPGPDILIDKRADSSTVRPGGLAGFRITVRNRGRVSGRNVRVCDHLPRKTTFVTADRRLQRLGSRRCLLIPRLRPGQRVSFHLTLRVSPSARGTFENTADAIPGSPPAASAVAPAEEDNASFRVRGTTASNRPPRVTG